MSSPIIEVYMFESVLNMAVASYLIAGGVYDAPKQNDNDGLRTPRVELKTVLGPWGPNATAPHMWVPTSGTSYPDCRDGNLYAKVITKRGDTTQDHDRLVGTVRGLLQERQQINGRMEYHTLNRFAEGGSVPDFAQDKNEQMTVLSFTFRMQILYATKTAQIFPS